MRKPPGPLAPPWLIDRRAMRLNRYSLILLWVGGALFLLLVAAVAGSSGRVLPFQHGLAALVAAAMLLSLLCKVLAGRLDAKTRRAVHIGELALRRQAYEDGIVAAERAKREAERRAAPAPTNPWQEPDPLPAGRSGPIRPELVPARQKPRGDREGSRVPHHVQ